MVLTKEELIGVVKNEVRILAHLAGKVDAAKLDYRPTPKQRSMLELLQYMAIMGPTQIRVIQGGVLNRETMGVTWGPADAAAKKMTLEDVRAAIGKQGEECAALLGGLSDADLRAEVDMFGNKSSRGMLLVNLVVCGYAAYRNQLFCYLKACGQEELNTMNLWAGVDGAM